MILQLLSTLVEMSKRTTTTECTVQAERIVGGVRLACSDGTVIDLTAAECLEIAEQCGIWLTLVRGWLYVRLWYEIAREQFRG